MCDVTGKRFLEIIYVSLSTDVFPKEWRKNWMVGGSVPKVRSTKLCKDFRLINTETIYDKNLEIVVKSPLQCQCVIIIFLQIK